MKKLLALTLIAGMVAFVACGPSKKEKEAKEKAKQDSINAAEKAKREADSLATIEKAKAVKDSLRKDSIAKAEKKQPKGTAAHKQQAPATQTTPKPKKGHGKIGVK